MQLISNETDDERTARDASAPDVGRACRRTCILPPLGRYFTSASSADTTFSTLVVSPLATSEDLSTQIINNTDLSQKLLAELVPIIYRGLKATA